MTLFSSVWLRSKEGASILYWKGVHPHLGRGFISADWVLFWPTSSLSLPLVLIISISNISSVQKCVGVLSLLAQAYKGKVLSALGFKQVHSASVCMSSSRQGRLRKAPGPAQSLPQRCTSVRIPSRRLASSVSPSSQCVTEIRSLQASPFSPKE